MTLQSRRFPVFLLVIIGLFICTAWSIKADALSDEQKDSLGFCQTSAAGVLEFANYRDKGFSRADAFKAVTQGYAISTGDSAIDQMEDWAYSYSQYKPEAVAAYAYGSCVLSTLNLLDAPISAELIQNVETCQSKHESVPEKLRACINDKTADIVSAHSAATVAEKPPSKPVGQMSDSEYSSYFRCQPSLTEANRKIADKEYANWVKAQHPYWTRSESLQYQSRLFTEHNCRGD